PGIVMTGRMDDKTRTQMLSLPIVDYITKDNVQAFDYLSRILKYQLTNHKTSILVVDDSLIARRQVCKLLARRNFTVYEACDGHKALEAIEEHPDITMVITDNEMPGMGGVELVQKLRKDHDRNKMVIIGVSGTSKEYQSARFIKNGADDYLTKPFCPEEFYCRITQNIEKLHYLEQIERAANTDYLTSMYNRRYFYAKAEEINQNRGDTSDIYVIAMMDIDFFKKINDTHGHDIGDQVLVELSALCNQHFPSALTARFGGEEFAIMLSGAELTDLESTLDAFIVAVANHVIKVKNEALQFTLSLGFTVMDELHSIEELLAQADQALYKAKATGRNKLVMSSS
ncbi:MAG: diguanylate cyclase response regulator, partial [Alteromonadaceae bacterium]